MDDKEKVYTHDDVEAARLDGYTAGFIEGEACTKAAQRKEACKWRELEKDKSWWHSVTGAWLSIDYYDVEIKAEWFTEQEFAELIKLVEEKLNDK